MDKLGASGSSRAWGSARPREVVDCIGRNEIVPDAVLDQSDSLIVQSLRCYTSLGSGRV